MAARASRIQLESAGELLQRAMDQNQPIAGSAERASVPGRLRAPGALAARLRLALMAGIAFVSICAPAALAQRRLSRVYQTPPDVRLQLTNRTGTIVVEGWERNEIKLTADMESPYARFTPEFGKNGLVINVLRGNEGHDVGDVNFKVRVPFGATVDLETLRGQITVRSIRGQMVRAHITTEGDIELTGIRADSVMAENSLGNILFDAELVHGGTYALRSMQGDINLRISADQGFNLTALAPRTRRIDLGEFAGMGSFSTLEDRRKVVGKVGDGSASLMTTNWRGSISFARR